MRYFYSDAPDALSAKTQYLKEHHRYAKHCFQNTWGKGYVIFDTKEDVNLLKKKILRDASMNIIIRCSLEPMFVMRI